MYYHTHAIFLGFGYQVCHCRKIVSGVVCEEYILRNFVSLVGYQVCPVRKFVSSVSYHVCSVRKCIS